jgi:ribokinase
MILIFWRRSQGSNPLDNGYCLFAASPQTNNNYHLSLFQEYHKERMVIVVFGSLNLDLVAGVPRLPQAGETLIGTSWSTVAGGKGANQAVACARQGAATRMVGRVGTDAAGAQLRAGLLAEGIDCQYLVSDPLNPSGTALILLDPQGENSIVVLPNANGAVDEDDLARLDMALEGAQLLVLQLELPLAMVIAAAQRAVARGVAVLLDPAPAQELPAELYPLVSYLCPNQHEASALVGFAVDDVASGLAAGAELRRRGVAVALVKLGEQGVVVDSGTWQAHLPAHTVAAIDRVAAGDAFAGALAAALVRGASLKKRCATQ